MSLGIAMPIEMTIELANLRVQRIKVRNVLEKVMGFGYKIIIRLPLSKKNGMNQTFYIKNKNLCYL